MERAFRAMGTHWWLRADGADASALARAEEFVATIEATLSRFLPASTLSRLNRERRVHDAVLAEVARAAEEMRLLTHGAFDARVGAALIAAGYDRTLEEIEGVAAAHVDARRPEVHVEGVSVVLSGEGRLDLGGIAKGWTVDRVADLLAESGPCVVDGGGDIRVRGRPADAHEWRIGAGDGLALGVVDAAVATSSTLRRRWRVGSTGTAHHIIDPQRARPASGIDSAVVVAPSAAVADAIATALVADAARPLPALPGLEAEAMLQYPDGRWEMTAGMERYLR